MLTTDVDVYAFAADFNSICVKHKVPLKMCDDGAVVYTDWNAWANDTPARLETYELRQTVH